MISRNDSYCLETINSIIKANKNEFINIYFSIKKNIYLELKDKINEKINNINIIQYENQYKNVFDHMKSLINHCTSDYIMMIHDDDNVGVDFFTDTYKNLKKFSPDALSSRATYIDGKGEVIKRRQLRYINKTYILTSNQILNRYFLPFKNGHSIMPTIAFKNEIFKTYWLKNKNFIGLHEDVKIVYYFSQRGRFYESGITNNFFYRLHQKQASANKVSFDRKLLNKWLANLKLNLIYKFFLVMFAKFQYFVFYKDITLGNNKSKIFISAIRNKIHNYRSGFD